MFVVPEGTLDGRSDGISTVGFALGIPLGAADG